MSDRLNEYDDRNTHLSGSILMFFFIIVHLVLLALYVVYNLYIIVLSHFKIKSTSL